MHGLGKKILKDVSRSFYLSMRVLPRAMREPVSLGYLLARASDTLADAPGLDAGVRVELLDGFAGVLAGDDARDWALRVRDDVAPVMEHEGERVLLEKIGDVLAWLRELGDRDVPEGNEHYAAGSGMQEGVGKRLQDAIVRVMSHILRGQRLDIERFEFGNDFRFSLDAELEEYCYWVAGCVGEFWTEVGGISLGNFSRVDDVRLRRWGVNFGKGLQLINVLRDVPEDMARGRCYLPGVEPGDREGLLREAERWRARARDYLAEGQDYARSLVYRRTRAATALPGLIGERTLDLLDEVQDWESWSAGVKVSRREVYRCAWEAWFV